MQKNTSSGLILLSFGIKDKMKHQECNGFEQDKDKCFYKCDDVSMFLSVDEKVYNQNVTMLDVKWK